MVEMGAAALLRCSYPFWCQMTGVDKWLMVPNWHRLLLVHRVAFTPLAINISYLNLNKMALASVRLD